MPLPLLSRPKSSSLSARESTSTSRQRLMQRPHLPLKRTLRLPAFKTVLWIHNKSQHPTNPSFRHPILNPFFKRKPLILRKCLITNPPRKLGHQSHGSSQFCNWRASWSNHLSGPQRPRRNSKRNCLQTQSFSQQIRPHLRPAGCSSPDFVRRQIRTKKDRIRSRIGVPACHAIPNVAPTTINAEGISII